MISRQYVEDVAKGILTQILHYEAAVLDDPVGDDEDDREELLRDIIRRGLYYSNISDKESEDFVLKSLPSISRERTYAPADVQAFVASLYRHLDWSRSG